MSFVFAFLCVSFSVFSVPLFFPLSPQVRTHPLLDVCH